MSMNARRIGYRYQRTLLRSADVMGIGFLTGAPIRLRFNPASPSTGVVFIRTDLQQPLSVAAQVGMVSGTQRRTTLGRPPAQVALVEHVLAALAGLRIDNCIVELNGPEPPGLDGSAQQFVDALRRTGVRMQPARRAIYTVDQMVLVSHGGATLALHPCDSDELRITYALDYGLNSPIDRQTRTETITPETFVNFISSCRTFLLESEAHELRRQGLGSRTSTADLLIFGPRGVMGNRLRYADEPARHKILDLIGDLALFGHDLRGHVVAYRSGHPLNVELVRKLSKTESNGRHYQLTRAA
jgi:UDP-3-O-[3-hydroxymyristoyl] N-acetylglucosamine deacetylase